jgi:hypothetical protein
MEKHSRVVETMRQELAGAFSQGKRVRFQKNGTNSTRGERAVSEEFVVIDIGGLNRVLSINTNELYIDVEPRVPMDVLVRETLKYGLAPPVVPEFPGITVGGAIQGGALESSSFRFGQFNDNVTEAELLLADGTHIIATPENEYADLFWGISTSYGSLAVVTRVRLRLLPSEPYVQLSFHAFDSPDACATALLEASPMYDFAEGIVFSRTRAIAVFGEQVAQHNQKVHRFLRNIDPWYYRFVRDGKGVVTVPIEDYLFRYDKGAFWMGEYLFPLFGLPSNVITRLLFAPFLRTRKLYDGLSELGLAGEFVIQDFFLDRTDVDVFLRYNESGPQIYPLWLCPIRSTSTPQKLSSHYRTEPTMLLNLGIYGRPTNGSAVLVTKELERIVSESGKSRKMLYALTFMEELDFWNSYDRIWYEGLREKYRAKPFRTVYQKVHSTSPPHPHRFRGILRVLLQTMRGKNIAWW